MSQESQAPVAKTAEEIVAEIAALRKRVEMQHPSTRDSSGLPADPRGEAFGSPLPLVDLLPLFHSRDAAQGKVAAIGKMNPRPAGPLNSAIQSVKRLVVRGLSWFVRDQVDFNYATVQALTETMEAFNAVNRSLVEASARLDALLRADLPAGQLRGELDALREESDAHLRAATDSLSGQILSVRAEAQTAVGDEQKRREEAVQQLIAAQALSVQSLQSSMETWVTERLREREREDVRLLRTLADVQNAFMQRISILESEWKAALEQRSSLVEERSRSVADQLASESHSRLELLLHEELRLLRQRVGAVLARESTVAGDAPHPIALQAAHSLAAEVGFLDEIRFSELFRGSFESVTEKLRIHVPRFVDQGPVLDLGCGRGEFLELLRQSGVSATGVEANPELVRMVSARGLHAVEADLFDHLRGLEPDSVGGVFCAHVIEHMPPSALFQLITLSHRVLRPGGVLVFETPNPACLAIFSTYFYLDPTHVRPVPSEFVSFLLEEQGFREIAVDGLHPAVDEFAALKPLPDSFRQQFFGFLDYAVGARKM